MIKDLELKHLSPYLPYGLKAKNCFNEIVEIKGLQYGNESCSNELWTFIKNRDYLQGYLYECKPILRPLSDLTKEIEHNGENFVPIDILRGRFGRLIDGIYVSPDYASLRFQHHNMRCFIDLRDTTEILNKLFEWHFDVFGLIEKGLAIDINVLKEGI